MKTYFKYSTLALAVLLVVSMLVCGGLSAPARAAGTAYYVDCSASSNGDGSQSSPWNNLGTVNGTTFAAGDSILLKRGTTCSGLLWPKGSGSDGSPIVMGAYGTGALPIINGGSNEEAIKLYDQEYWEIENLETTGGTTFGVYVGASDTADTLDYFRLTNLDVHDVYDSDCTTSSSGPVTFLSTSNQKIFNDVIIDNVSAYDSNQFGGINFRGSSSDTLYSTNVTIRNSMVDNVYGDGIVLFWVQNGVIENSVALRTGMKPDSGIRTPSGIWTWRCDDCTVQHNESYLAQSYEGDGGGFDVDYCNVNNTYQYNYAHDNELYCISVFGGDKDEPTVNSVVRYNICSNNCTDPSRKPEKAGDIYITVWSQGKIQDTFVYNNTSYWNPAGSEYYAIKLNNVWHGKDIVNTNIYNNIVYSASPKLVHIEDFTDKTTMDYNLYWYTGTGDPEWKWGSTAYSSFSAWQSGSGQDANGMYADPKLNSPTYHGVGMPDTEFTLQSSSPAINAGADLVTLGVVTSMGSQDFFGNAIPQSSVYDIGAHEYGGAPPPTDTPAPPTDTPEPTATDTPAPPTDTPEPTATPTDGPSPTPTDTPVPPTDTPIPPTDTPAPPTDTPTPTNTPGGSSNKMHVQDVAVVAGPGPGGYSATGTITIVDEYDQPVEEVHVNSQWSGCVSDGESGDTDANGQVTHSSPKAKDGGTFTLCVTALTKDGWVYDEAANVETCDSDVAP